MTAKETFIDAMRAAGYDFMTACERYEEAKEAFLRSGKESERVGIMAQGRCVRVLEFKRK